MYNIIIKGKEVCSMRLVLMIIAAVIVIFDVIMITPLGAWWMMKNEEENKPAYGVITVFVSAVPLMIIFGILGWI